MERTIKLLFVAIIGLCSIAPIGYEKLFFLTLASTNEYDYNIDEIQTKGGYIVFNTSSNQKFLATIVYVSSTKSMLKITPYNNSYSFSKEIPQKVFNYIETNQSKSF
jgi:hypothetical protein